MDEITRRKCAAIERGLAAIESRLDEIERRLAEVRLPFRCWAGKRIGRLRQDSASV